MQHDGRKEYTLDIGTTVIESEKREAKWTYKKVKGYQPILGFIFELGLNSRMSLGKVMFPQVVG